MGVSRARGWSWTDAVPCTTRVAIYHRRRGDGTALESGAMALWAQLALIGGAFWLWIRKAASSMMLRTSSTRVSPEGEPTTTPAAK